MLDLVYSGKKKIKSGYGKNGFCMVTVQLPLLFE